MIDRLTVRNFRCLRDVTVDLGRLTVFVGPNGSGKSSILQSLDLLCRAFRDGSASADEAARRGFSPGATGSAKWVASAASLRYRLRVTGNRTFRINPDPFSPWQGDGLGQSDGPDESFGEQWRPAAVGQSSLPHSALLRLEIPRLLDSTPSLPDPTVMRPDGTSRRVAEFDHQRSRDVVRRPGRGALDHSVCRAGASFAPITEPAGSPPLRHGRREGRAG